MGVIKRFTEVRFVLRNGTFCSETPEHFVLRIIYGHNSGSTENYQIQTEKAN